MTIRILMVTDAEGSYHAPGERFSLTELVATLEAGGCEVTKAHRWGAEISHTQGADLTGFKFTPEFDLKAYDQVWLMGFASSNPEGPYLDPAEFRLSTAEMELLAQFMNAGGGLFATGDHDDLGADLCASVPRVRSMRQWSADYGWRDVADPNTFEADPTRSPPPFGPDRIDTLVSGHDDYYAFQDQSDDVPQKIEPVMHLIQDHVSHKAGGFVGYTTSIPHPLLCGPEGVIDVLPDHMHEGRCVVPKDLTTTFTAGGQTFDEYPKNSSGTRISPEVVAWGNVEARNHDPAFQDPDTHRDSNQNLNATTFPIIVAYNGQEAGVGRVVVDATFHHFVNINVTGVKPEFGPEPDPSDAVKAAGFLASPEGQAHYAQIKAYWLNIAKWLCPPQTQKQLAWQAFRRVALDPRLKQTALFPLGKQASPRHLQRHGRTAWGLFTEGDSTCLVFNFIFDVAIQDPLSYLLAYPVYVKLTLPDPPPWERVRRDLAVDRIELAQYVLGAAMTELRQPENLAMLRSGKLDAERGMALVQRAALTGLAQGLKEQAGRMEQTLRAVGATLELCGDISAKMGIDLLTAKATAR